MPDNPISDDAYLYLRDTNESQKRIGRFVSGLDYYLSRGMPPKKALLVSTRDYAHEYYFDQCFGSRWWYMWRWNLVCWFNDRDIHVMDWLCYDDGDSPFRRAVSFCKSLFGRRRRKGGQNG